MNNTILLATDCSEYSEGAVREAINMAKSCDSRLYVMSVAEINPEFMALAPLAIEEIEKTIREYLEKIMGKAAQENVECEIIIREGEGPHSFIIEEADKKQADLIVMGRRGRTGLSRVIMGSETARVIGHTSCKVLVVPRSSSIKWKSIIIATDGSKYSEAAARESIKMAKKCTGLPTRQGGQAGQAGTCSLLALAVIPEYATEEETKTLTNAVREIKQNAEKENLKTETSIQKGKPSEIIVKFAKEKNADIIVMGSHGRTGIQRLLMGSVTAEVIGHTDRVV
ncbi:MAG: universal stress protein, partial [Bacteroidota bacterium]